MRGFLALELDKETRLFLGGIQSRLKEEGVRGNFSKPENLHVTIKFLGELDASQLQKICSLLKNVAQLHHPFVLTLDSFGKFDKGNKLILWAGLKRSCFLLNLHRDVEAKLEPILPSLVEKTYSPHITLAREVVSVKGFLELQKCLGRLNHAFTASGLSLMESTRVNGRLTYIRVAYESFKSE